MPFGATILAVSLAFTGGSSQISTFPTAQAVFDQPQTVEEYVRDYFADEPIMIEIASCESQFRQFDKEGQVLQNPGSSAVGVFQIMSSIHKDFAKTSLAKTDIYSLQGNAAYARYLYERQGTSPWNASKACWSKSQAYKDIQAQAKLTVAVK